jgi:hypothetical protein
MASCAMLRRVALVRIDIAKKLCASIIRVTTIERLVKTLAITRNRRTLRLGISSQRVSVPSYR